MLIMRNLPPHFSYLFAEMDCLTIEALTRAVSVMWSEEEKRKIEGDRILSHAWSSSDVILLTFMVFVWIEDDFT